MFQSFAFQSFGFQTVGAGIKSAAGKLRDKLKRDTRVKANADMMAERYKKLLASKADVSTTALEKIVAPFVSAKAADYYQLPKAKAVDFEAMARDAKTRKEFLQAAKAVLEEQEEQMTLIILLAAL